MARRKLRKSSIIVLILISFVLIYRVYMTYFQRDSGICYNQKPFVSSKSFVTVAVEESLENLMFQYASLLGLANINKRRVLYPANTALEKLFNVRYISSGNTECWEKMIESIPMGFDVSFTSLPQRNVSINGYLQSWKYFQSIEQTVRREFSFKSYIMTETKNIFNRYIDNAQEGTVVGVQITRNNILNMGGRVQVHNRAPITYIQKAMKHMRDKYKNVKFLVVCDDTNWCQAYLKDVDIFIADESDTNRQLALLSICDHSIITVGTLGYWGAWLANGYTVYYKHYIRQQSALAQEIRYEDFFPPHWVPLGD